MLPALIASTILGLSAFSTIFSVYALTSDRNTRCRTQPSGRPDPQRLKKKLTRLRAQQDVLECRLQALESFYTPRATLAHRPNAALSA